jgi:hypothetical protein
LDECVTRRSSVATRARVILVSLGLVAALAVCVTLLVTAAPAHDRWSDVGLGLAFAVLYGSVHWCFASGLVGRIMAFVLRTRPNDLENEPRTR